MGLLEKEWNGIMSTGQVRARPLSLPTARGAPDSQPPELWGYGGGNLLPARERPSLPTSLFLPGGRCPQVQSFWGQEEQPRV